MPHDSPAAPNRAFALAATTAMTALSMTLAAAMLSARAQWQLYAAKSAEKNIIESATTAESQDFMQRVRKKIESATGDSSESAGSLTVEQLFQENPFRRVELRGGIARVQGTDKPPLLYKNPDTSGIVGDASSQINSQANRSIEIPALWVSGDPSLDPGANPGKNPLGKDDPFYDINCRSSFAAVSAYSAPRRENMSSTLGGEGFGNLVVVQTRTFPVSAFTSMQFGTAGSLTIEPPPTKLISLAKNTQDSASLLAAYDVGRVYTRQSFGRQ